MVTHRTLEFITNHNIHDVGIHYEDVLFKAKSDSLDDKFPVKIEGTSVNLRLDTLLYNIDAGNLDKELKVGYIINKDYQDERLNFVATVQQDGVVTGADSDNLIICTGGKQYIALTPSRSEIVFNQPVKVIATRCTADINQPSNLDISFAPIEVKYQSSRLQKNIDQIINVEKTPVTFTSGNKQVQFTIKSLSSATFGDMKYQLPEDIQVTAQLSIDKSLSSTMQLINKDMRYPEINFFTPISLHQYEKLTFGFSRAMNDDEIFFKLYCNDQEVTSQIAITTK
jgi:hypothetical protein